MDRDRTQGASRIEPVDPVRVHEARRALARVREAWLARPGVTGLDVGFRLVEGDLSNEVALRVHVVRKRPLDELATWERLPRAIDGVPVDVIEFSPPNRQSSEDADGTRC